MNLMPAAAALSVAALSLTACTSSPEPRATETVTESAVSPGTSGPSSGGQAPADGGSWTPPEGDGGGSGGTDARGEVPSVDVATLGARLGWEGCGDDPVVDMEGYPVVVCIFPDEYAVPGQDGNAVRIMTFDEWEQADAYMASHGDPEVTVVEEGYIVDGPHSKAIDAAAEVLEGS